MDFLNKAKEAVGGNSANTAGTANPQGTNNAAAGQQQDYGDKAFDFASKKAGHPMDQATSEKITDGARGLYEKATGNKVDPKYSN